MNLIGIDIGGTKCAVVLGVIDSRGVPSVKMRMVFPTPKGPDAALSLIYDKVSDLMQKESVSGIGISCGGPLDSKNGIILSPPNLPGWDNIHITDDMHKRFGVPVLLMNDANACALAEWRYGAGKGYDNVVFFTFGTGMGAGLILDGKLYSGTCDLAGEVGHLRLSEFGPVGFGKAGSFEGWCSGGGIAQVGQILARREIQMGRKVSFCNSLSSLQDITARSIAEAAYAGDRTAAEVYRIIADYLGRGLAMVIDMLNPQVIILGSIYGRSRDLIEPYMNEALRRESISFSLEKCTIVPAGLGESIGDMAALTLAIEAGMNKC